MPKDNIERAIAKGTGAGADADAIESVIYEGYGPGGVALLVEAMTDNRNRTGAEMRHMFGKHGGNLGEPGSVAYLFDKKGVLVVDAERYGEDDLIVAIEAGAEDIAVDDDVFEVLTEPADLAAVRRRSTTPASRSRAPRSRSGRRRASPLDEDGARKLHASSIDALEDNDDVDAVHANFDVRRRRAGSHRGLSPVATGCSRRPVRPPFAALACARWLELRSSGLPASLRDRGSVPLPLLGQALSVLGDRDRPDRHAFGVLGIG